MASGAIRASRGVELDRMTIIGVIADTSEQDVIREFFEFFKTPWEFYRKDRQYEVLLCAGDHQVDEAARLILVYSAGRRDLTML